MALIHQAVQKCLLTSALILLVLQACCAMELLQTLEGTVGRENFTYYRLTRPGDVQLRLESLEGDTDLFVSDETLYPDFEHCSAYSDSCGIEVIDIPHTYKRPVGIGIYGHSYFEVSKFRIRIYAVPPPKEDLTYEQLVEKFHKYEPQDAEDVGSQQVAGSQSPYASSSETLENEESEDTLFNHFTNKADPDQTAPAGEIVYKYSWSKGLTLSSVDAHITAIANSLDPDQTVY